MHVTEPNTEPSHITLAIKCGQRGQRGQRFLK